MTIRPGGEWGSVQVAPPSTRWFASESALGKHLVSARGDEPVGLTRGDLYRITGQSNSTLFVPIDLIEIAFLSTGASSPTRAVALSWIALGRWWSRSDFHVLSNTGLVDGREWFVRSHPNDARVEHASIAATMDLRQRLMARRRISRGLHFAHPLILTETVTTWKWSGPATRLVIDGQVRGAVTQIEVSVRPDAQWIYVGQPSTGP